MLKDENKSEKDRIIDEFLCCKNDYGHLRIDSEKLTSQILSDHKQKDKRKIIHALLWPMVACLVLYFSLIDDDSPARTTLGDEGNLRDPLKTMVSVSSELLELESFNYLADDIEVTSKVDMQTSYDLLVYLENLPIK